MNWQVVFFVLIVAFLTDAKKPDNKGKPDTRKREKLSEPINVNEEGVFTKVMGKSGRIEINIENASETDRLTLLFDAIHERDSNLTKVGKKGKLKHSLETFAPLEFLFTPIEKTMFNNEINASYFTFSTDIPGTGANISVNMYFFKGEGNGSVCENQTFDIYPGLVKFDITIENWSFCTPSDCNGEEGSFVDFVMTFQKKGKAKIGTKKKDLPKGKKAIKKMFFPGGQDVGFPSSYEIDDSTCGVMPDDYPMIKGAGGDKYSVIFRFPKFAKKVFYDPTVGDSRDEAQYTDTSTVDQPTSSPTTPAPGSVASYTLPSLLGVALVPLITRFF